MSLIDFFFVPFCMPVTKVTKINCFDLSFGMTEFGKKQLLNME